MWNTDRSFMSKFLRGGIIYLYHIGIADNFLVFVKGANGGSIIFLQMTEQVNYGRVCCQSA